ncbi:glycogen synthase GlgA [Amaricoccus macauensis]|uniref:glycogen synthase GlgA n=1 Tax=Amaricoccus macauensis TaxID=57001 RepID=UPI003C7DC3A7
MRILSVASEIYPLIKTGGLADVAGALPPALSRMGMEVKTLVPGYPRLMEKAGPAVPIHDFGTLLGVPARLLSAKAGELDLLILDAPGLYDRQGGPYLDTDGKDYSDNWHRFAAFSLAGALIAGGAFTEFVPDLVHAHDWQAALVPAYMKYRGIEKPSVLTIHNLAFQGQFSPEIFSRLELPPHAYSVDGVEYYGGVGFLKAGLQSAWALTTVSPTYAKEIRTPAFGMGLDGLISTRSDHLHGIVNGIDIEDWNPETDPHLGTQFSIRNLKARVANRRLIEGRFSLDADDAPLFIVVSRLTDQKGLDIVASVVPELVEMGAKLAVLGTGDPGLEHWFLTLAGVHEGRIGVQLTYDEALAHVMQGGADAILIPSRFEPCGLTQLYAQHYGTIPVVARTGGLADTVIDANSAALAAGVATGIQFPPDNGFALVEAIQRLVEFKANPKLWTAMQRQGMRLDVSWNRSAAEYASLFASLVSE